MTIPDFVPLDPPERGRTYHYPDGSTFEVEDTSAIAVSESGHHRLETAGGGKFIVAPGWNAIEIDSPAWSL